MKSVLKSLGFVPLLSWNVHAYASGDNFLDKLTDIEADILYGEAAMAELPAEALALIENSSTFAEGESIIVFDEDQGMWQEKQITNAGLGHSLLQVACVLGGIIAVVSVGANVISGSAVMFIAGKVGAAGIVGAFVGWGMVIITSSAGVTACLS